MSPGAWIVIWGGVWILLVAAGIWHGARSYHVGVQHGRELEAQIAGRQDRAAISRAPMGERRAGG